MANREKAAIVDLSHVIEHGMRAAWEAFRSGAYAVVG